MLNQHFREFIRSLNDNQARYLVVGGCAVAAHGHPRYTRDLDICPGVEFPPCYAARVEIEVDGLRVNFVDIENLRKNKRASGRHQDLADVENLQ